jgi:hypothetical protein
LRTIAEAAGGGNCVTAHRYSFILFLMLGLFASPLVSLLVLGLLVVTQVPDRG